MKLEDIKQIAVIGCGTMGAGIAQTCLMAGFKVIMQDINAVQLAKAQEQIARFIRRGAEKGQYSSEVAEDAVSRLTISTDLAVAGRGTDWVIEAIFENMDAKRALYTKLDEYCHLDTVFASNTSGLSVSELGMAANRPQRFVGMHFFNPVPLMPLLEIVRGAETDPTIVTLTQELGVKLGKEIITCDDSPNFIVNRINRPVYFESQLLVSEGVTPQAVDQAMVLGASFRQGALATGDASGLEVGLSVSQHIYNEFGDPKYRPIPLVRKMVRAGHLGRKAGRGFYLYPNGSTSGQPLYPDIAPPEMPRPQNVALVGTNLAADRLRGKLTQASFQPSALDVADLVLVAMSDDLESKEAYKARFTEAAQQANPAAVLAVMHPLVSVTEFGTLAGRPTQVVGVQCPLPFMHDKFFEVSLGMDTSLEAVGKVVALLGAMHYHWVIAPETPAGIVLRVISCMVNEAAFGLQEGLAPIQDVDTGMRLGMSYGLGPFEYADRMEVPLVLAVLEHLQAETGDPRYRPAYILRKMVRAGKTFY